MICDFWADWVHVLWLNTHLTARRISHPAPAASSIRTRT